jgi:hypothetical protein
MSIDLVKIALQSELAVSSAFQRLLVRIGSKSEDLIPTGRSHSRVLLLAALLEHFGASSAR